MVCSIQIVRLQIGPSLNTIGRNCSDSNIISASLLSLCAGFTVKRKINPLCCIICASCEQLSVCSPMISHYNRINDQFCRNYFHSVPKAFCIQIFAIRCTFGVAKTIFKRNYSNSCYCFVLFCSRMPTQFHTYHTNDNRYRALDNRTHTHNI